VTAHRTYVRYSEPKLEAAANLSNLRFDVHVALLARDLGLADACGIKAVPWKSTLVSPRRGR
jgi:hypothetical protein